MKFTENRTIAYCVLALAIAFSVLIQGSLSMQNQRGNIEEKFMGSELFHQVDVCAEAAGDLARTAGLCLTEELAKQYGSEAIANTLKEGGYFGAAEKLTECADRLTKRDQTPDPNSIFACIAELKDAADKVFAGAEMLDLPDNIHRDMKLAYFDIGGALDILSRDDENKNSYTVLARKYNETLKGFPASLFADVLGVTPLTVFGG